jgi:glutathione S-transferase
LGNPPERQADLESKRGGGYRALDVMERQLSVCHFIANDRYSIADIALYAYTHVANEGGFDLSDYPKINAWLSRVEQQENYVPMATQT